MRTSNSRVRNQRLSRLLRGGCLLLLVLTAVGLSRCNPGPVGGGDGVGSSGDNCPAEPDTDGDGFADACDTCPASPNAGQADADGDGLGDECSGARVDGFAFSSSDGTFEVAVDGRLRPTLSVGPHEAVSLLWSDDSSSVAMSLNRDSPSMTLSVSVDFQDQALLEAVDAEEEETGLDLTELRDFVRDRPGFVELLVHGEAEAPDIAARVRPQAPRQKTQVAFQQIEGTPIYDHLQRLSAVELILLGIAGSMAQQARGGQIPDELIDAYDELYNHFLVLARFLREERRMLVPACILNCTDRCPVACLHDPLPEPMTGACCYLDLDGAAVCEDNITQDVCSTVGGGIFHVGGECGSGLLDVCMAACCITAGTPGVGTTGCCFDLLPETCAAIESNRDPNSNVTTEYDRRYRCGDPAFDCPICR